MEVERFKHRQLVPTVGPSSRSSGEFEGPLVIKINLSKPMVRIKFILRSLSDSSNLCVESLHTCSRRFQLRLIRRSIKSEAYQKLIRVRSWCTTQDWKQFTCRCPHQARDVGIKSKSATSKTPRPLAQVHQRRTREQLPRLHRPAVDYSNDAAAGSPSPAAVAPLQQHRAPWLLVSRSHGFYIKYVDLAVRRDYSSPGRTGSTSTSPCAAATHLRPHALYVDLVMRRDYSSPAARALRQPRRAPRVLIITLPITILTAQSTTSGTPLVGLPV
jgi:hypothetical protein